MTALKVYVEKEILSLFIPVVHASSFLILIRMYGRPTPALLLMWDIALAMDVIAVSRDDQLMYACSFFLNSL